MVVGTVFIMLFGMATVSMIESIDDSIRNSEYNLPNPEVSLTSVTDQTESTGPAETISLGEGAGEDGSDYPDTGSACSTTAIVGTGIGLTVDVIASAGAVTSVSISDPGSGYAQTDRVEITGCATGSGAIVDIDSIHEKITITIENTGSDTVELSHILITLSDTTGDNTQGKPFYFTDHYSSGNLYLFPGESLSSDPFTLNSDSHGFAVGDDPNRAWLAIYDYNSAITVNA
tara:strand:- start:838 stop:1530 length:693 start_codon:yes stop_codon:yes gene_type:complete